jgi:hypothetical protein
VLYSIRDGKYNKRLLSELLAHEKFRQFMIDAEIYVDRIADSRVNDMNTMLEIVRKQVRVYLANLVIDYDTLKKEEFATLIGILSKSKKLQIRQKSQRGKRKRR